MLALDGWWGEESYGKMGKERSKERGEEEGGPSGGRDGLEEIVDGLT
jgi:hypothetical protein